MHAPMAPGAVDQFAPRLRSTLDLMDSLNVRFAVLNGVPDVLFAWRQEAEDRVGVLPSLLFPCLNGVAVMWGRPCFDNGADWPDLDRLRDHIESGRVEALEEIATQFLGLGPSDPSLEPYFALAEEYDLPVFIHMGPGLPGTNYGAGMGDLAIPSYRAAAGNPLLLEEALLRHPGVRVAVMHAGWPLGDEMVFMLYQHPRLYAEVGLLHDTEFFPRTEYYPFLKRLVDAGFSDRILFGSDSTLKEGIDAVLDADFLTEQQKRDILCNNAARFLKLDDGICE
ncbi:MAG TPA: amidohydrolase family protein [Acidobacteriota bacterium]|nr:amidohydrolase family protein [Acidobacteriota bacterium]